ncbi:MAG: class I SAM-dependent methyltransferase [Butyricicoccus pullicaecorum]|nr:SAM-dependent methyltransferase [Butyricicoccus pullicaecorum]MDO4669583.1 class I SAM-dependent methyltransferase [Butyricicoccus pullicaecorum]
MTERTKENLSLTPRLQAIADRVPKGAGFADIGTDHGHLPLWLLHTGVLQTAIACDLREGPLEHARENARFHGLSERVSFRLAAGLDAVRAEECDTISIAGMGGETIAGILQAAPWTAKGAHKLLLQPMTMLPQLRQWLWAHGYQILEETVCREGKRFYILLTVQGGGALQEKPLSACYFSQELLHAEGASDYLQALLRREIYALRGMQTGAKTAAAAIREQEEIVRQIQIAWEAMTCPS